MNFQLGKRWIPTLTATLKKLAIRDPTITMTVNVSPESQYRILMESDHQDFIRLDAKLRSIVMGKISKRILT